MSVRARSVRRPASPGPAPTMATRGTAALGGAPLSRWRRARAGAWSVLPLRTSPSRSSSRACSQRRAHMADRLRRCTLAGRECRTVVRRSTSSPYSAPTLRDSFLRSHLARAGALPPVEIATCRSPRRSTDGKAKWECSLSSTAFSSTRSSSASAWIRRLTCGEFVAARARKAPSRSPGWQARGSSVTSPRLLSSWRPLVKRSEITVTAAPASRRVRVLVSPTTPPPTTTACRPATSRAMGRPKATSGTPGGVRLPRSTSLPRVQHHLPPSSVRLGGRRGREKRRTRHRRPAVGVGW